METTDMLLSVFMFFMREFQVPTANSGSRRKIESYFIAEKVARRPIFAATILPAKLLHAQASTQYYPSLPPLFSNKNILNKRLIDQRIRICTDRVHTTPFQTTYVSGTLQMKDHEEEIKFLIQEEGQNVKTNAPKRLLQRLPIICFKRKLVRSKLVVTMAFLVLLQLGHHYFRIVKRYNRNSYYIHYQKKYDRCKFQDNGPEPAILMALGRSGSSVTWDTLARLSGDATIAHEITGGNQEGSLGYFNDIKDHINEQWASLRLCNIQRYYMDKSKNDGKNYAMVGFQWKPFRATFDHHYAIDGLRRLADDGSKVIYLTRNPLDRYV